MFTCKTYHLSPKNIKNQYRSLICFIKFQTCNPCAVGVVDSWNQLPEAARTAKGKEAFKRSLRQTKHWKSLDWLGSQRKIRLLSVTFDLVRQSLCRGKWRCLTCCRAVSCGNWISRKSESSSLLLFLLLSGYPALLIMKISFIFVLILTKKSRKNLPTI